MVVKCLKASLVTVKAGISTSSPSRWLKSESEGRYDQRDREAPDHAGVGWKPHAEAWKRRFCVGLEARRNRAIHEGAGVGRLGGALSIVQHLSKQRPLTLHRLSGRLVPGPCSLPSQRKTRATESSCMGLIHESVGAAKRHGAAAQRKLKASAKKSPGASSRGDKRQHAKASST